MEGSFQLELDFIQVEQRADNWEEAIKMSAKPLLENGFINDGYLKAMIDSVHEHGPYIVIAPRVAMPHARPETGALKMGFSVLKLQEPVKFSEEAEHEVDLLVALSCENAESHIQALQFIVGILSDQEKFDTALKAEDKETLLKVFSS